MKEDAVTLTLNILFWCMEAAYVIHCLDETIAGDGFVAMVRKHFWPEYKYTMFFWFNTFLHCLNILSIILYEISGGARVVFPLTMCWLFVTNGLWHVLGSIMFKEYSPGLMTSLLYWIVMYLIIRLCFIPGQISGFDFYLSLVLGTIITVIMIGSLFIMRIRSKIKNG